MLRRLATAMLPLLTGGVFLAQETHQPNSDSTSLSHEIRDIIRPKCGSCHTSILPSANPKACAVFDLAQGDWPTTMSKGHLQKFKNRLNGLTDSLKTKIDQFVKQETSLRKNSGS
jgi:hypothetical protein